MISIQADSVEVQRVLALLVELDVTKGMRVALLNIQQRVRDGFRNQADPWGDAWAPHSNVTVMGRIRRGSANRAILVDSGAMFSGIGGDSDNAGFTVSITAPDSFPVVHQFGNPNNRAWGGPVAPIPPRAMLPIREDNSVDLPPDWWGDIVDPIAAQIEGIIS
jgi:hypothetical protein